MTNTKMLLIVIILAVLWTTQKDDKDARKTVYYHWKMTKMLKMQKKGKITHVSNLQDAHPSKQPSK